jgi:hypothetical protein
METSDGGLIVNRGDRKMNIAYQLIFIVFLLNFPVGASGCQQEKAPDKAEQQTEEGDENALASLRMAKAKLGTRSETAGKAGNASKRIKETVNGSVNKNTVYIIDSIQEPILRLTWNDKSVTPREITTNPVVVQRSVAQSQLNIDR